MTSDVPSSVSLEGGALHTPQPSPCLTQTPGLGNWVSSAATYSLASAHLGLGPSH